MSSNALVANNLPIPSAMGSLEAYIGAVHQIPVLSVEDEQRLAVRLREHNDIAAAQELILSHLRFVVHVARGYSGYGLQLGDLIQEGNIGLMKAVKRFDPTVGVRLVSFAVHWIRAEMHEFIIKNWRIVKVATTKAQRKLFFNLRSAKKRLGWMNRQEVEAVARDLDVPPEAVIEMEQRLSATDPGLDGPGEGSDEHEGRAPVAYLEDMRFDPATRVEEEEWETRGAARLREALTKLDGRSRDILEHRWLADERVTLQELADRYNVSAERIRQLEANAMRKLKAELAF